MPAETPDPSISQRVRALIFNGLSAACAHAPFSDSIRQPGERERIAEVIFAELRAGNIEFRLGPLALLAEAIESQAARPSGESPEGA